jgi:hypothetical protein
MPDLTTATAPGSPLWATGAWRWFHTPDRRLLVLSILLQLCLAVLFGHSYDTRVFMAAGYLVGTGQNPYVPHDLSVVFHHVGFNRMTTIGYPPPWALVSGLAYRGTYALVPNLLIYGLALKIPVIAATIGLAYLVAAVLQNLGAQAVACRRAWAFLLFNPLILYVGAAWGQIDAIATLFAVAALVLVWAKHWASSAALLALAICIKPTPLPILLVVLVWLARGSLRRALRYAAVFAGGVVLFYVVPFPLFGWSVDRFLKHGNAHFHMYGALSYTTAVRLFRDPLVLSQHWWLVGLLWIPALAAGLLLLRRAAGFEDLVRNCAALVLIFFLTRTLLAEPDVLLVLPLMLILTALGGLDRRALLALWLIPLVFTVFNASPLQLLWVAFPSAMQSSLTAAADYHGLLLAAKAALVVAWQVAGWWTVVGCLKGGSTRRSAAERAAA